MSAVLPAEDTTVFARALAAAVLLAVAFTAFAGLTTQFPGIRAGSPWQDDPYNCVVSLTMFLVPVLAALIVVRARLNHDVGKVPEFRVRQLLRAGMVSTVLVTVTVLIDALAAVLGADRPQWNDATPWMISGLVLLASGALIAFLALAHASRRLPPRAGHPDGDWLDDVVPVVGLGSRMLAEQLASSGWIPFIRKHIVAFAAGASLVAAALVVGALAIGERWTDPFLALFTLVLYADAVFAVGLICNVVLEIALTRKNGRAPLWIGVAAGSSAGQVTFAVRDSIWGAFDGTRGAQSVWQLAVLFLSSALVVGSAAWFTEAIRSRRRRPPGGNSRLVPFRRARPRWP